MIASDTVSLALRNLGQAKLRTTLTVLGVSIGIASLAGMVSLGVGLEEQTVGKFMSSGVFDAITVAQAQPGGGRFAFGARIGGRGANADAGRGRQAAPAGPDTRKPLDDDAVAEIAALPNVKEVYPNIQVPIEMQFDQSHGFSTLAGVPMSQKQEGAFQTFAAGGFFPDEASRTCLLSLDQVKRMTDKDPKDVIGQVITVAYAAAPATPSSPAAPAPGGFVPAPQADNAPGNLIGGVAGRRVTVTFTIAGIVEREPGGGFAVGASSVTGLMIPQSQAKAIDAEAIQASGRQSLLAPAAPATPPTAGKRAYRTLTVKVARAAATMDVEDKIKGLGFSAFSLTDALQGAKRLFIVMDILLSLIGSIALAVSSLGIVNTMVMSILERTREIGIMKAIGGSDADVRGIFLVEASAIGLLGGISGIVLGWVVGRLINFGANIYIRQQGGTDVNLFSLPLWLIGGAIGFSILVSLLAGSYPARRAARLNPIEALRHD